jgi:4-amino-4-deoxy-L-arabinose transferase-like glycosyltransferase
MSSSSVRPPLAGARAPRPSGAPAPAQPSSRARERAILAAGLLACLALYVAALDPTLFLWGDNAHYIIVAKSLATGHGLRDIHTPGSPPFTFPVPLFPLALAPIVGVFDYDLVPLKLFVAVTGVLTVLAALRLFRCLLDTRRAVLLTVLVAVSPQIVSFSHQVMTELPYLGLSLAALLCAIRYAEQERWTGRAAWATALALAAATLTRTIGGTLVLAVAAYLVIDGAGPLRRRVGKAALASALCAMVWLAANASILAAIPYYAEFRHGTASVQHGAAGTGLLSRVMANITAYTGAIPETVYYGYALREPAPRLVGAAILLVMLLGFAYAAWRKRSSLEYYCAAYAGVLLLYEPSNAGNLRRYLVPLVPFLLYYFIRGVEAFGALAEQMSWSRMAAARWWRPATLALLVLIGFTNFARTVQASVLHRRPEMFDFYRWGDFRGYRRMAEWVRASTPASSVIGTRATYIFHIWSRRQVLWLPYAEPGAADSAIAATARREGMSYITSDSIAGAADSALFAVLARDHRDFARVYAERGNRVYRVLPDTGGMP